MSLSSDAQDDTESSQQPRAAAVANSADHPWTLLSNYAHVLVCIARDPDLTLRGIAEFVGVTERAVHRIVGELESAGVISIHRSGRRNHYELDATAPLRHPLEADCTVGDLLSALVKDPSKRRRSG